MHHEVIYTVLGALDNAPPIFPELFAGHRAALSRLRERKSTTEMQVVLTHSFFIAALKRKPTQTFDLRLWILLQDRQIDEWVEQFSKQ